jgi:hypothetical protein
MFLFYVATLVHASGTEREREKEAETQELVVHTQRERE